MIPTKAVKDNGGQYLLSTEIAELTGKTHNMVMRDIRRMCESLGIPPEQFCSGYIDQQGKTRSCYKLPAREVKILITGYDVVRRAKVIDRLDELEGVVAGIVQVSQSNESTIRLCHDIMLTVPGIDPGLVTSCTLRMIQNNTGMDTEPMRRLLPSLKEDPPSMNATAVGKEFGWDARMANMFLREHGFQRRNDRGEWELTEIGRKHGGMIPFTRNGHSSYQPLWKQSVVNALRSLEKEAA